MGIEVEIEEVEEKGGHSNRSGNTGDDGWEVVGPAKDDEDEDDDGAILFLPTGFSRPRRKTFYKGSDPEWQDFKRIASDRPRVEKIRGMHHCARH